MITFKSALTFTTAAVLAASAASAQTQQPITGGSSGSVEGPGVSASTYGDGQTDGQSLGVNGGGAATAEDGTASTRSDAKLNERRAMQRSVATARTDEERARSRTRTVVRNGEEVRSRTMSIYKKKGERPVREHSYTVTDADGTVTKTPGGQ